LEALRLPEQTGDPVTEATIASDAHPFCWTGRLQETVLLIEKAIALGPEDLSLGRDLMGFSAYLLGLTFRGLAVVEMGRLEEATSDLDRASQHPDSSPLADRPCSTALCANEGETVGVEKFTVEEGGEIEMDGSGREEAGDRGGRGNGASP
jgi:hypothetical protein